MESPRIQKPTHETIESEFLNLPFTRTAGYSHYAPTPDESGSRAASIEQFLADPTVTEPHMGSSPRHSWDTIHDTAASYDDYLAILASKSVRTLEEDALMDRVITKVGELFRYEELLLALGSTALEGRQEHRRLAANLSLEIMGGVDRPVFSALVNELHDMADESKLPVAAELKELVSRQEVSLVGNFSSIELEDPTRGAIRGDLYELLPGLEELAEAEGGAPVAPAEAVDVFRQIQRLAGMGHWDVRLEDSKSVRTSSADETVYIGANRSPLSSQKDTVALGVHEAVVHGGRAGGVQCANTLDFEEGLATRIQQIISGEKRTPGVQYYLSIGLQAGVDRGATRNYRDTFEIMWRREVLLQEKGGQGIDEAAARARAQRQVHRTRRGGAIDTRDSSYFFGAQKAARWLNELALQPADVRLRELRRVLTNRIDPTVPEHIAMTQEVE